MIEIEVDGMPVEVDAEDWGANPDQVMVDVRAARQALRLSDDVPLAQDYDTLVGDDS